MARRGGSRSSRKRKAARRDARKAAQAVQPSRVSTESRAPASAVVRVPLEPARRLSDLYPVNPRKLAKPARPAVRKAPALDPVNPEPAKGRPLPASVKAFRASQLEPKPRAAAARAWQADAAKTAPDDRVRDKPEPALCQQRPERKSRVLSAAGGGVKPPRKFVPWCN